VTGGVGWVGFDGWDEGRHGRHAIFDWAERCVLFDSSFSSRRQRSEFELLYVFMELKSTSRIDDEMNGDDLSYLANYWARMLYGAQFPNSFTTALASRGKGNLCPAAHRRGSCLLARLPPVYLYATNRRRSVLACCIFRVQSAGFCNKKYPVELAMTSLDAADITPFDRH